MKAFKVLKELYHGTDNNKRMIKRELIADVIQNPLKAAAAYLSGSQAVKAELMRAAIDFFNHLVMISADNRAEQQPDERYNYGTVHVGYKKLKNMAVLLPGFCFAASGVYNILSPLATVYYGLPAPELHLNTLSLSVPAT
jgi:divalent metal cation (Fe/Co/Zn/Cd) transporter